MIIDLYVMGEYRGKRTIDDNSICGHLLSYDYGKAMTLANMLAAQCCQSENHKFHRGDLWQCSACHGWFCQEEGATEHHTLCDSCWSEQQPTDM